MEKMFAELCVYICMYNMCVCNAGKIKRRQVKIWNDLRAIYGNCSGAYQIDNGWGVLIWGMVG